METQCYETEGVQLTCEIVFSFSLSLWASVDLLRVQPLAVRLDVTWVVHGRVDTWVRLCVCARVPDGERERVCVCVHACVYVGARLRAGVCLRVSQSCVHACVGALCMRACVCACLPLTDVVYFHVWSDCVLGRGLVGVLVCLGD